MQANYDDTFSVLNHPSLDQSGSGRAAVPTAVAKEISIESTELLRGSKTLEIRHNGSLYLLRTTKLGKLILTK
ncbi:hemin uptake protein HemP [Comamonadaceae bacterium OTU4NAUVB1]|jgi:hemin uptake protein HemP|nr:hemin uptake protein HemP [Comamonadaceae bacterium OTU4NAUVB1]HSU20490.1 hemin uptake protein HemP [Variovorax sp.]